MNYRILESDSRADLERAVEAALAEGWTLQGGVALVGFRFAQAVTRAIEPASVARATTTKKSPK